MTNDSSMSASQRDAQPRSTAVASMPSLTFGINRRFFIWTGIALCLFGIFGLIAGVVSGQWVLALISVFACGGLAYVLFHRVAQDYGSFIADASGIHLLPVGSGVIRWSDIQAISVVKAAGTKSVGIRLKSYEPLIDSVTPERKAWVVRNTQRAGWAATVIGTMGVENLSDALDARKAIGDASKVDMDYVTESTIQAMRSSREKLGVDMGWSAASFNRPVEAVADQLESYRARATTAVSEAREADRTE